VRSTVRRIYPWFRLPEAYIVITILIFCVLMSFISLTKNKGAARPRFDRALQAGYLRIASKQIAGALHHRRQARQNHWPNRDVLKGSQKFGSMPLLIIMTFGNPAAISGGDLVPGGAIKNKNPAS
jgi:hypothetical protein